LVAEKALNAGTVIRELGKLIDGNGGGQPFCFWKKEKCKRNSTSIRHGNNVFRLDKNLKLIHKPF
jgi:hypothetical protein